MDAKPILARFARALREQNLEAVLVGVTTLDIDFLIRKTPANITKLKRLAGALAAVVFKSIYPVSGLFRLIRDDDSPQLDFMTTVDGFRSYTSVRRRAVAVDIGGERLWVAPLAVINVTMRLEEQPCEEEETHHAPVKESELNLREQIRRLLAKPPEERTHFLRRKVGITGSCL